eukprot:maker-scaffold696_size110080-snap-gene-0.13 protein:Tk12458 transcript:maker-scaffold696_size110080-snap-gene-0.13-mRNA-1 annotation:"cad86_drome ame: full"
MMNVMWSVLVSVALHCIGLSSANKPVFDLSNNMRLVLLPADTKMGTIIYKLRASDADEDYPLQFKITGDDSNLIDVVNVDCSLTICQADVILLKPLSRTRSHYNLNLEAIDTRGESTLVETELELTPHQEAFMGAPRIVRIPETSKADSLIETFIIMENMNVFRGISCQLLPVSAREYFKVSPGLPTAIRGESRCDLRLIKELDYEARSSFVLQILAENAWTDARYDTRNVIVHEFIVEVQDVQDSAPYFLEAPPVTRLPETAQVGDTVLTVKAFDGDYAHPRRIRYGLDPRERPFSSYFQIDPDSGIVTVRKNLQDIETRPNNPVLLRVLAEEIPDQKGSLTETLTNSQAEVEVAVIIDDVINSKPRFLQNNYITNLKENAIEGTKLVFDGDLDIVEDIDKGENGKLELFIEGEYQDTFEIAPAVVENRAQFVISVKNNRKLDFEKIQALTFKITARELGINKLSCSASVTVNLMDVNDNSPSFLQDKYIVEVFENQIPGQVILQVRAKDPDSQEFGDIAFARLTGNDPIIQGLHLDPVSGEISVTDNMYFDREAVASHVIGVEAVDHSGQSGSRTAQATIVINLKDVNDQPPRFLKKKYQGFMNSELTQLRNDLQVEAADDDETGSKNSQVRYEIIKGNYERKFGIDEITGVITVAEPLTTNPRSNRRFSRQPDGSQFEALSVVDPIITLMVRAYDLGIPSLDAEVPVYIYTEDMFSRTMRFIISQEPKAVEEHQAEISDLISAMTGGNAEIQDINPYYGNDLTLNGYEIAEIDIDRESKAVASQPQKTVVDVFIRYPANSVVDMNAVTSKLVSNSSGTIIPSTNPDTSSGTSESTKQELESKNAALFWTLVTLCLIIAALILITLCCYCCPGCYYYKGDKVNSVGVLGSEGDIQVLTVTDGEGRELKDARFVEIMKSAKDRIRSAASLGRTSGLKRWRVQSARSIYGDEYSQSERRSQREKRSYELLDPRESESIILVREAAGRSSRRSHNVPKGRNGPYVVNGMEELDAQALRDKDFDPDASYILETEDIDERTGQRTRRRIYHSRKTPNDKGKIFKMVDEDERNHSRQGHDDVQVLRLDDDSRREETYRRVGGSEILSLDNPKEQMHKKLQVHEDPRRTRSELDLVHADLPDDPGGEFYTAVGPDGKLLTIERDRVTDINHPGTFADLGKEIILRRYLNDQAPESDPYMERGFLNMAMFHLQHQQTNPNQGPNQGPSGPRSTIDPHEQVPMRSPRKLTTYVDAKGQMVRAPEARPPPGYSHGKPPFLDGYDTGESVYSENESTVSPYRRPQNQSFPNYPAHTHPPHHPANRFKHKSVESHLNHPTMDLTPKHNIRTPILEETESTLEAERLRSRQSRRDKYKLSYDTSDASVLRFRINDGVNSPEPAYTETKASILRRRNTMAKMLQEEENRQIQEDPHHLKPSHRYRHWSLNELNRRHDSEVRDAKMRKWNSLSNDELLNHREDFKYSLSNTRVPNLKATNASVSLPSRSSSVMSYSHREGIGRMIADGQNSRSMVDENFAKNIGVTPESSGRPGTVHLRAPYSQVPESGSEMNSLEYTFDHNGEVVSKDDSDVIMVHEHPKVRRHTTEIRKSIMNATPRYMDWYTGQSQTSPTRKQSRMSTISAPAAQLVPLPRPLDRISDPIKHPNLGAQASINGGGNVPRRTREEEEENEEEEAIDVEEALDEREESVPDESDQSSESVISYADDTTIYSSNPNARMSNSDQIRKWVASANQFSVARSHE